MLAASGGKNTLSGASAESAGAWQNEVAERRQFPASTAAVFGSEIANRNSLRVKILLFLISYISFSI
jgi:hypothetical protein